MKPSVSNLIYRYRIHDALCASAGSALWALSILSIMTLLPDIVWAKTAHNISTFEGVLCKLAGWGRGDIGKALGTIGIMTLGITAVLGRITWGTALVVGIGIAALFGAPFIVMDLVGGRCV